MIPMPRRRWRGAEGQRGYKAVAWPEANGSLLEAFMIRNVIMYTLVGAIVLVPGFGIFNINDRACQIAQHLRC